MRALVDEGDEVAVTSTSLPFALNLKIRYRD